MAEMTRFNFIDVNFVGLTTPLGPLGRHMSALAERVVQQAIQNALGRPGPEVRTGDLIETVHQQLNADEGTFVWDVASDAEHRGYPYPSRLETGDDGPHYPWLVPALIEVFESA